MRNWKKFLALTLAATMLAGNSVMVLADDEVTPTNSTSVEGTGEYEGDEVDYPANSIVLPTLTAETYNYLADPNGLIADTEKAHYSDATFDDGKLWFLSDVNTYTKDSTAVKVTSENPNAIDVSVKLEVSNADSVSNGIGISTDKTFANDTKTNMYFAIVDTDATASKVADVPLTSLTSAVTLTKKIDGVPGNYDLQYAEGAYSYKKLTTGEDGFTDWNTFEFKLEGAINSAVTWDDITTLPTLKVTWSWEDYAGDSPKVSNDSYEITSGVDTAITLSLGTMDNAATGIESVVFYNSAGVERTMTSGTDYTYANGVLTLKAVNTDPVISTGAASRTYKVTFSNGVTDTFIVVPAASGEGE